jgi:uncharacterized protein
VLLALSAAPAVRAVAAPGPFPEPTGYVSDFAEVIDVASADSIAALGAEIRAKTGAELAVVTLRDLGGESIDPVATALFEQWGVGR